MFHAIEDVVMDLEALVASGATGLVRPLRVLQFIGEHIEPWGQEDFVVLEILPGGFGADFPATMVRQQVEAMMGALGLELGVRINPGHRTGLPALRHCHDFLHPPDNRTIGVEFRRIRHIPIIGHFVEDHRLSLGRHRHSHCRALGARVRPKHHNPVVAEGEIGTNRGRARAELRLRLG